MATDQQTEINQTSATSFEKIWKNLEVTDQEENNFQFSNCRNRHIVVVGSQKTATYVVGDVIQRDAYGSSYLQPRKEEQKTITYMMVPDDETCNVCIINLIDIPPLEYFIKITSRTSKDSTPSPMVEVDKTIFQFATNIDLIVLVCNPIDVQLMSYMKKWASDRKHIMALVLIVDPQATLDEREALILSIRNNKEFIENDLGNFFEKGIFCLSDLSYKHFKSPEEQNQAQHLMKDWRLKFLRTCIGSSNDTKYEIVLDTEKHSKTRNRCKPS